MGKINVFTQTLMFSCNAMGNGILQNYSNIYIFGAEESLGFFSTGKLGWEVDGWGLSRGFWGCIWVRWENALRWICTRKGVCMCAHACPKGDVSSRGACACVHEGSVIITQSTYLSSLSWYQLCPRPHPPLHDWGNILMGREDGMPRVTLVVSDRVRTRT